MSVLRPSGTVELDYCTLGEAFWHGRGSRIDNVSAAAIGEAWLWTASDEGAGIESLRAAADTAPRFETTASRPLIELFPSFEPLTPVPPKPGKKQKQPEADLEALALEGRRLWLCGAHCWAEKDSNAERDKLLLNDPDQQAKRRARTLLGFLDLDDDHTPRRGLCLPSGDKDGGLLSAVARAGADGLTASLMKFSKRGGFDIEGLAARGDTLLIGLRGPVIGGEAMVLRVKLGVGSQALAITMPPEILRLDLVGGRGIRDLLSVGDDILVLAGPTGEAADAPDKRFTVHGWRNAWSMPAGVVAAESLPELLDLTPRNGNEKPEGLALLPDGRILVVHDGRLAPDGKLTCDVYELAR